MLLAGDEFGQTQHGNNNAYCQDSPLAWLDWNLSAEQRALLEFTRESAALAQDAAGLPPPPFLPGPRQSTAPRSKISTGSNLTATR